MKQLPERFVNLKDGRGTIDTQMPEKTLRAQEEAERAKARPKPTATGFKYPSELEQELKRKQEES